MNEFRTRSFVEKCIDELKKDEIVGVVGTVIKKDEGFLVMDDGSGSIIVTLNSVENKNIKENGLIRVVGRVLNINDNLELQADFVQDFDKIDRNLHRKVRESLNNIFKNNKT